MSSTANIKCPECKKNLERTFELILLHGAHKREIEMLKNELFEERMRTWGLTRKLYGVAPVEPVKKKK